MCIEFPDVQPRIFLNFILFCYSNALTGQPVVITQIKAIMQIAQFLLEIITNAIKSTGRAICLLPLMLRSHHAVVAS